jgi:hypothetical protein
MKNHIDEFEEQNNKFTTADLNRVVAALDGLVAEGKADSHVCGTPLETPDVFAEIYEATKK